jgi:hypothetical protein
MRAHGRAQSRARLLKTTCSQNTALHAPQDTATRRPAMSRPAASAGGTTPPPAAAAAARTPSSDATATMNVLRRGAAGQQRRQPAQVARSARQRAHRRAGARARE